MHRRNFCAWFTKRRIEVFKFRYIIVSHEDALKLEPSRKVVRNTLKVLKYGAGEGYRRSVREIM